MKDDQASPSETSKWAGDDLRVRGRDMLEKWEKMVIVVIIALIVIGFVFSAWSLRYGHQYRTDYSYSGYYINIYPEEFSGDLELMIPVPSGDPVLKDLDIQETEHGEMIKIDIQDMMYNNDNWRYDIELLGSEFSTQENDTIWIYANLTNVSEPVYFTLFKKDHYDTWSILEEQIDYVGVMTEPFLDEYSTWNACGEYTEAHKVELQHGWNQYHLIEGAYNQYAD